jgi:hypothetical protein
MNRLVLPIAALLLAFSGQTARAQLGAPPNQPLAGPVISPFLNLNRSGASPGINYFGLVRPQLQLQSELTQLQTQVTTQQYLDNTALTNRPITDTGTGAGFMNYNRYFLNVGRPGTSTGGMSLTTPGVTNFGFLQR